MKQYHPNILTKILFIILTEFKLITLIKLIVSTEFCYRNLSYPSCPHVEKERETLETLDSTSLRTRCNFNDSETIIVSLVESNLNESLRIPIISAVVAW